MSDEQDKRPRRSRSLEEEIPDMPSGWRTSRRSTRSGKKARKDVKAQERKVKIASSTGRFGRAVKSYAYILGLAIAGLAGALLVLVLIAAAVNGVARWNARRSAGDMSSEDIRAEQDRNNLLLIALEDGRATGFLALRNDAEKNMAYGIAIPDAAFIEVPGQGFERVGNSYEAGPDVSAAAIANFLGVPFSNWAVIDGETYKNAVSSQSLAGVMDSVTTTNLSTDEQSRWQEALDSLAVENVAIVPLPTEPINVGSQTYLDPQRDKVADLIEQWWDVSSAEREDVVRLIVYNGAGVPGIAGTAGQVLIREGYRVVDTKNADSFDYEVTQIVVQHGDESTGGGVRDVLGVGEVVMQPSDQEVADVIVIVGKDYKPPKTTNGG
ncbi:MAG: LytR C-terminal domain-containing protein [Coriobacteriia bacterium]|nr:LytR C-terminal domain-containing protein [Coriobacteriia bacterium]